MLPALNMQGPVNGVWIQLCTSNGAQLVYSDDAAVDEGMPEEHKFSQCPCSQHLLTNHEYQLALNEPVPEVRLTDDYHLTFFDAPYPAQFARAPPISL